MTIPPEERRRMLAVRLCGMRVIARLESIGIVTLADLASRDPHDLIQEVNIEAGRPIWHPPIATQAMANLVSAARKLEAPVQQRARASLKLRTHEGTHGKGRGSPDGCDELGSRR